MDGDERNGYGRQPEEQGWNWSPGGDDNPLAFLRTGEEHWELILRSNMSRDEHLDNAQALSQALSYQDYETAHFILSKYPASAAADGKALTMALFAMVRRAPDQVLELTKSSERGGIRGVFDRRKKANQQQGAR